MLSSTALAILACVAGSASAQYTLVQSYDDSNFLDEFSFYTSADPTAGFVDFVDGETAGLAYYTAGQVYMGVDYTTVSPPGGRQSVRVTSNTAYTHGLFIGDFAHMPTSTCGVWPAWWTFGPNWPANGEIDIIEGVNQDITDTITLHTSQGCVMDISGSLGSSTLADSDCNADDAGTGCAVSTTNTQGYGNGFNDANGGVYAMEWTSDSISVWHFPRSAIPADITNGAPVPSGWGAPAAKFGGSGCDIDSHFSEHNIIFDTTFCGDWAGKVWADSSCASMAATCDDYVSENPAAFSTAYWLVNSVKVYQDASDSTVNSTTPVEARSPHAHGLKHGRRHDIFHR